MSNSWFSFKRFTIEQQGAAMKVGTDGVLVGSWGCVAASTHILDIGTGTGLIALMAAQRTEKFENAPKIDALEIEPDACIQAKGNIAKSPWSNRINLIEGSVFDYKPEYLYDVILCNPPFFIKSLTNPNAERTLARHCRADFSHENLIKHISQYLLNNGGSFSTILPVTEANQLIQYGKDCNMLLEHVTYVFHATDKECVRKLMTFRKVNIANGNIPSTPYSEDKLVLYSSPGVRSEAYNELMRNFYL